MKLDRDSNVIWANRNRAHHDLEVLDDGTIYVLTRKARVMPRIHETEPILEDFIAELSPEGETRRQISLIECFENSEFENILTERPVRFGDIFHTNSIRRLDGRFAGRHAAFGQGNLLISIRELDAIVIVDPEQAEVIWAITGPWDAQHDAQLLDSGTMLVFDNRGADSGSRVIEFDPLTMEQVWVFESTPGRKFSSLILGTNQRLENGNTLVTESNSGRALEVTPDGCVVWEFVNPHRVGRNDQFIAALFEVERIDAASVEDWLETPASSP